jgi:hypothetical protein
MPWVFSFLHSWQLTDYNACYCRFLEHLLNRSTESEANGRRIKYEIVKMLAESTTGDAFEAADVMKLRVYERQGAFYVPVETQVAMEND